MAVAAGFARGALKWLAQYQTTERDNWRNAHPAKLSMRYALANWRIFTKSLLSLIYDSGGIRTRFPGITNSLDLFLYIEKRNIMQQHEQTQNDKRQQPTDNAVPSESWDQLEQKLTEEQQKAEEYLNLLQRTQADFINYRRRSTQELIDGRTTAQMAVLERLLPVLDDLGRALDATPPELANHPWVQGILLVSKRLMATLEQLGVRQVGKLGEQFDPRWHEALTMEPRADVAEGTIVNVARQGYTLAERVIRPAQVVVAGAPSRIRSS